MMILFFCSTHSLVCVWILVSIEMRKDLGGIRIYCGLTLTNCQIMIIFISQIIINFPFPPPSKRMTRRFIYHSLNIRFIFLDIIIFGITFSYINHIQNTWIDELHSLTYKTKNNTFSICFSPPFFCFSEFIRAFD